MHALEGPAPPPARPRWRPSARTALYVAFWLCTGLLMGLAEWQHYVRAGRPHPWEPFVWELSSVLVIAVVTLGVARWDAWLMRPGRPLAARVAGHLAGLAAFTVAHSALMMGLRAIVYALAGVPYRPGTAIEVLGYEAAKDAVTYAVLVAGCHGLRVLQRAERQAADLARLEAQLSEARLAHLQSQIQPHFLFNTLNLISSVMYEDVDRADVLIAELANLLRQAEAAGRHPVHALAEELRWVEPFLSIMRQRFGERLQVAIDVTPEAARCELPSLLLMGPVENAVTHGVAATAGEVRVSVTARVDGPWLDVAVVDEALGAAPRAPVAGGGGTGLSNTRARLEAHHGDAQRVSLAHEGARTVLRLRCPARVAASAAEALP